MKICESTAIILFFPVILISFAVFATKQEYLFSLPGSWVESRQYFIQIFSKPCSKVNNLRLLICKWNIDNEAL